MEQAQSCAGKLQKKWGGLLYSSLQTKSGALRQPTSHRKHKGLFYCHSTKERSRAEVFIDNKWKLTGHIAHEGNLAELLHEIGRMTLNIPTTFGSDGLE